MQKKNGKNSQADLALLDHWMITMNPIIESPAQEQKSHKYCEHHLRDAPAIKVHRTPIVALGVEESDHPSFSCWVIRQMNFCLYD